MDDWHTEQRELAERRKQPLTSSQSWSERLRPVDHSKLLELLTPTLALVGSVGMSAEDREEWLVAAAMTLQHLPEDLLKKGLTAARRKADHPAKIVPIVIEETSSDLSFRQRVSDPMYDTHMALPAPGKHRPTHAEVDEILNEFGIPSSYAAKQKREERGPPRRPTRQDYIDLGLAPDAAEDAAIAVARALLPSPKTFDDGQIGKHLPD